MSGKEHRILLIQPPFNRLYKDTYSLGRVPLSLSYLAGTVMMKKPEWWVGIYNSDFSPRDEAINYRYETGQGFVNYLKNLRDLNQSLRPRPGCEVGVPVPRLRLPGKGGQQILLRHRSFE